MRRFGRVFCCLAVSLLVGSLAAPPAAGQVWDLWFDEPHDGTTWHRGDVIRARIVPDVPVSMSGSHPVLELVLGENTRRVEGRIYQNGSRAQFYYTVQSVDAADDDEVRMAKVSLAGVEVDMDGVGIPADAISGGSIREADGSRSADTSHAAQDPSRDLQADATRQVACTAVPAGRPGPGAGPAGVAPAGRRRASGPAAPPHLNAPQPRRGLDAGDQRSPTPAYH